MIMANAFEKQVITTSENPRHTFSSDVPLVSTQQFMRFMPIKCLELVPNTRGKLSIASFLRADPMQVPCLGQLNVNTRSFLVRLASVWRPFYEFKTETVISGPGMSPHIPVVVPTFNLVDVLAVIYDVYGTITASEPDVVYDGDPLKIDDVGRRLLSILTSLGYAFFAVDHKNISDYNDYQVSAMPLLALGKIYLDWYYPQQYARVASDYVFVEQFFSAIDSYVMTAVDVVDFLLVLDRVSYDGSYLNSAWDNPVSPTAGVFSSHTLLDITTAVPATPDSQNSELAVNSDGSFFNGTPVLENTVNFASSSGSVVASSYSLAMLNALTAYMRSHQISGALALDRWLADFGLAIREDKLNRSIYLGSSQFPIQFGDVMSHSDTANAPLGAYAGSGIGGSTQRNHHHVEFDCKEDFCYLITVQSLMPIALSPQGIDRTVMHRSVFDFYTSRFDGKGVQAISTNEVYLSREDTNFNLFFDISPVFGFTQRYSEYKFVRPILTGDFLFPSVSQGLEPWHLMRLFDDSSFRGDINNIKHSLDFVQGNDSDQYLRIFDVVTNPSPFKVINWYHIEFSAPMLPVYDDYIFHDDKDHKKVVLDGAPAKMN